MVHTAYDAVPLVPTFPLKIEAIASTSNSSLLLACSDNSLRILSPQSDPSTPSSSGLVTDETYVEERSMPGFFSRRGVVTMKTVRINEGQGAEMLLVLAESIGFYRVPGMETVAVITKAKGANVCAWDERKGLLAFGRGKRVFVFRDDGFSFSVVRTVYILYFPDPECDGIPRLSAVHWRLCEFIWAGDTLSFTGNLLSIGGRGFVEVKEFGVPDTVKSMSWCGENICIGIRREYMILNSTNGALSEVFPSGRIAPPLVVSLPSGELLLGKDNIGVFVDQNGKLIQEGRIVWSEAPSEVVIQQPYAIALLPRYVEIRWLQPPYPLIQTIVLRNVKHLVESSGSIIVLLENSVYGLFAVPLGAQIVQLTASGNFEEALALCKLLPPEDSDMRTICLTMGATKKLWSNLRPPEKLVDAGLDASDLSRGSSAMSDDMEASSPVHLSDETSALESKKMSHNTLMALIKFLQKKRFSIIEKAAAEGTDEAVLDAAGTNFRSYDSKGPKKFNKGRGSIPLSSGARERAAVLDTALLQALVLTGQSSTARELLKGLNYCDLKICEEILQKMNLYAALLELCKCNSMHREALKLLHQLVEESKSDHPQLELARPKIHPRHDY
ncbi:Vacuolar sorting protein 39-like protein [Drosera capensis]